jgi:hypothetical protein
MVKMDVYKLNYCNIKRKEQLQTRMFGGAGYRSIFQLKGRLMTTACLY